MLLKIPSMFGKFLVHVVWRFKQRTFYIGSLRVRLILTNSISDKVNSVMYLPPSIHLID